ncbi:MAG: chorismate-binding protein, partial [Actinobacteria bacterium]|nr:chorismate-binding protein [Actinomycetota bacterium]
SAAWQPNMSAGAFRDMVARARDLIAAGDIFQANLALAFRTELPVGYDPLSLYLQLRAANPAPFAALIVAPDRLVASTSPARSPSSSANAAPTVPWPKRPTLNAVTAAGRYPRV